MALACRTPVSLHAPGSKAARVIGLVGQELLKEFNARCRRGARGRREESASRFIRLVTEQGPVRAIFRSPAHPYTQALIGAVLEPEPAPARRRGAAPGDRDDREFPGCPYAGRCPVRLERCFEAMPDWHTVEGDQHARCFRLEVTTASAAR